MAVADLPRRAGPLLGVELGQDPRREQLELSSLVAQRPDVGPAHTLRRSGQEVDAVLGRRRRRAASSSASRRSSGASASLNRRSASARFSVTQVHIVASAVGMASASRPLRELPHERRLRVGEARRRRVVGGGEPTVGEPRDPRQAGVGSPAADPDRHPLPGSGDGWRCCSGSAKWVESGRASSEHRPQDDHRLVEAGPAVLEGGGDRLVVAGTIPARRRRPAGHPKADRWQSAPWPAARAREARRARRWSPARALGSIDRRRQGDEAVQPWR